MDNQLNRSEGDFDFGRISDQSKEESKIETFKHKRATSNTRTEDKAVINMKKIKEGRVVIRTEQTPIENPKGKHKSDLNRNNVKYFNNIQNPILNSSNAYGKMESSKVFSNSETKVNPRITPYNFKIHTITNGRKQANPRSFSKNQYDNDFSINYYDYKHDKLK